MSIFGFLPLLQIFVGVADITRLEDFLIMFAMNLFSRVKSVMQKSARLILIGH